MTHTQKTTWATIVEMCRRPIGDGNLSCKRKDAILEAHYLLQRYKHELQRIARHPEFAQEFANDALLQDFE